jgi:DNA (cytosine-5)-methyltransferase 1
VNVFKNVPDGLGLPLSSKTNGGQISKTEAMVKSMKMGQSVFDVTRKYGYDTSRLHLAKPAPTLKKSLGSFALGFVHPIKNRRITISEAKRIMSFPDDFKFIGTYQEQWARIGNSVPPNLMRAIAEHIKNEILKKAKR